jgi:fatty acid desaturase
VRDRVAVPPGIVERIEVASIEAPTLLLAALVYGGWLALTWYYTVLPGWIVLPALVWLVAWQSSLQHEVLHGHPTRIRAVNDALGFPPLALWLPYGIYRVAHLRHHDDARLTDPLDDPESRYWTPELWAALSRPGRLLVTVQGTFLGRMIVGPAWSIGRFFNFQIAALRHDNTGAWRIWGPHFAGVFFVLWWACGVCRINPLIYIFAVVYLSVSLTMLRAFAEHKAAYGVRERIAIVERTPLFGLLFLYNNLHTVHHAWPGAPWYCIPALYRRHRERMLAANGGLIYNGYLDVARRFFLTPHDRVLHPLGRAPMDEPTP